MGTGEAAESNGPTDPSGLAAYEALDVELARERQAKLQVLERRVVDDFTQQCLDRVQTWGGIVFSPAAAVIAAHSTGLDGATSMLHTAAAMDGTARVVLAYEMVRQWVKHASTSKPREKLRAMMLCARESVDEWLSPRIKAGSLAPLPPHLTHQMEACASVIFDERWEYYG